MRPRSRSNSLRRLMGWLLAGEWRAHPLRSAVAIFAIAVGVALGFAIHLINSAALHEFSAAVQTLSGQADLQVRGRQEWFDEALYPALAQHPGVAAASPVLELDAALPGQNRPLKIIGVDVFRAAAVTPELIGTVLAGNRNDTLADDSIFLSPAALQWLQVQPGQPIQVRAGTGTLTLLVAGTLTGARPGQRLAVMDIGALQWRLHRLGQLSRIDLKLQAGADRAAVQRQLQQQWAGQALVSLPQEQQTRTASMSRAYRVNLNVLALVALFTGAFLVFSSQAQAVIRRRSQLALLRVLGLTRRQLLLQLLAEGALLGTAGSQLGLLGGFAAAAAALRYFGADLGGGYFPGVQPSVAFAPGAALLFFLLGTGIAILGSAVPAWEAARAKPAPALKAGSEEGALSRLATPWPALACLVIGILFARLPPLAGLPVFGYLAVALLLVGGIALMPRLAAVAFGWLARRATKLGAGAAATLGLARLANAPGHASIALGGVLSSFSLMVAMGIMVASFRISVDDWLARVLPADLYVQAAGSGDTAGFDLTEQAAIATVPGVARTDFLRMTQLTLDPTRPDVALIARNIDLQDPGKSLALMDDPAPLQAIPRGAVPVWVSEAMVDLYGYRPGSRLQLPLGGRLQEVIVAGIWRDYVRQFGAIQMRAQDYRRLSGDMQAENAGLWLAPGNTPEQTITALQRLPFGPALEFSQPGEIRAASLKIFDRSFAVTYLLEAVAVLIGLFGVATTFSAQTIARAREFGMLRHIGVTRSQVLRILAIEGLLLTSIGIAAGFALGFAISLILVYVVNPQSFHWSMQLHLPWGLLASVALVLLVSATLTAVVAGRHAVSGNAVRAVREDW
ncbi:FtsX-like permease family protein [Janthinobacterium sp. 17J80-10]|uniref:FtsX-like permease family protein n=1 Tax=Janthinobacterium sp. 17J80-10 TaxID=2497863 RepID=UPI001005647E|nr:FtsX-like permease family protein [Janthinobacterium sp. 17J80-10]QAU34065.1 FtsX-like permease family protein [Janthinobacterium sp. 17J80-10]